MMSEQLSLDLPLLRGGRAASGAMGTFPAQPWERGAQGWAAASGVRLEQRICKTALPQGFNCFDGAQLFLFPCLLPRTTDAPPRILVSPWRDLDGAGSSLCS